MMILFNLLMILPAVFLVFKRIRSYDTIVNHLFLFSSVWIFIVVGAQINFPGKIWESSVLLFYACLYAYIFGSSILKQDTQQKIVPNLYSYRNIWMIIAFLFLCNVVANIDLMGKVVFDFSTIEAWVMMRNSKEFEEIDQSNIFKAIFQRCYLIYIPLAIFLFKNKKMPKLLLIGLVLIAVVFSLLRFTRAPFMNLLVMILIAYVFIYRVKIPIKHLTISLFLIFLIFGISQFFLIGDKADSDDVSSDMGLYLFGGILVFQDILQGKYLDNSNYDIKLYSFDWMNYIFEKLGFIERYPSYVREWSSTYTTNTYTYLDAFTLDFGIAGAILGSFTIGLISDYSYKLIKANNYNLFNIIFYGYICFYNIFVFANNEFIRFTFLLNIVILLILNLFTKKIKYE